MSEKENQVQIENSPHSSSLLHYSPKVTVITVMQTLLFYIPKEKYLVTVILSKPCYFTSHRNQINYAKHSTSFYGARIFSSVLVPMNPVHTNQIITYLYVSFVLPNMAQYFYSVASPRVQVRPTVTLDPHQYVTSQWCCLVVQLFVYYHSHYYTMNTELISS